MEPAAAEHPSDADAADAPGGRSIRPWVPHFVLWLSLLVTAGASAYVHRNAVEQDRVAFNRAVDRTNLAVTNRLKTYSDTLRHLVALYQTAGIPTRQHMHDYLARVDILTRYPGIQGIGFSVRLEPGTHEQAERMGRDHIDPSFRVWPEGPPRDERHMIMYLEPQDARNRRALGYDMHSEPVRAAAMDAARDTGKAVASGKVQLVQEGEDRRPQPGFLIYVPLYKPAPGGPDVPATLEERRRQLVGYIFAPFRAGDLFTGIFATDPHANIDFRLYDGSAEDPAQLLHDSVAARDAGQAAAAARFERADTVRVVGHPWTIRFFSRREGELASPSGRWLATLIFLAGTLVSLTFFALTRAQVRALSAGRRAVRELERSQSDLTVSESRFRRLADANLVGVAFCDLAGNVTWGNDEYFRIIGRPREQVLADGLRRQAVTPLEYHELDRRAVEQLESSGVSAPYEKEVLRPDGSRVWVLAAMAMLEGSGRECVALDIDITQRKRAERDLRRAKEAAEAANKAKDRFLAVLSHELRTPLAPVMLAVSIWERDPALPAELRSDFEMIRRNVELEARLIDDLLDLTRVGRGKLHLNLDVVDAHDAVRHALDIGPAREAQDTGLKLTCRLDAADASVRGDAARLQQIFWNLLHHAVKFTPDGGYVDVRSSNVTVDGVRRLRVAISDSGIGISAELLPRIFDAFEQGEAARSRASGGLGLGLAIARGLVRAHDGTLEVSSGGIEQGATFVVDLPTATPDEPVARPQDSRNTAAGADDPPAGNGDQPSREAAPLRILLVEDHPDSALVLARLLRAGGYAPEVAESVAAAAEAGQARRFDLLLSDFTLPDGTGLDVLRALRASRHNADIPAIALSGHGMPEDITRTEAAGFRMHLTKPVDLQQLRAAIVSVMDRNGGTVPV